MQSWDRLQVALSVMTEAIAKQSGTIGDFQGDAAMGFWGWPGISSASPRFGGRGQVGLQGGRRAPGIDLRRKGQAGRAVWKGLLAALASLPGTSWPVCSARRTSGNQRVSAPSSIWQPGWNR